MAMSTWQMVNPMAMRMLWIGVSPMAVGSQFLGDSSGVKIAHSY